MIFSLAADSFTSVKGSRKCLKKNTQLILPDNGSMFVLYFTLGPQENSVDKLYA